MSEENSTRDPMAEKMTRAARLRYLGPEKTAQIEAEEARRLPPTTPVIELDPLLQKVRAAAARRAGMRPDAPQWEVDYVSRIIDAGEAKYLNKGR